MKKLQFPSNILLYVEMIEEMKFNPIQFYLMTDWFMVHAV